MIKLLVVVFVVVCMSTMLFGQTRHPYSGIRTSLNIPKAANQCSISNLMRTHRTSESCCGEEGFVPEYKALNLPVSLRSNPFLWSQALGSDQKQLSERLELVSSVRWLGIEFRHPEGAQCRAAVPSCWKEPVEMVWLSGCLLGASHWRVHPTGRRPQTRPRIWWRGYISHHLVWECLKI